MSTAKKAEEIVKKYFKDKRKIDLVKKPYGEKGFDFRDKDGKIFVEVKGSGAKTITDVLFRNFTNAEYEKAKKCLLNKKTYEVHLVIGIVTHNVKHYWIPAKHFIDRAKPEIVWSLPVRKSDIQRGNMYVISRN